MALSATIALNPSSGTFNQVISAQVTISNSGMSNVTLNSLSPMIQGSGTPNFEMNSGVAISAPPSSQLPLVTIPAGGSTIVPFQFECFMPQAPSSSALTYSVGCNIITSDGSSFAPTPASLTMNTSLVPG